MHNLDFCHHDGTALSFHAILAPLIVVALIAAAVSVVAVVSIFALVCFAHLCLQFCVAKPTDSFLTNLVLFHSP